MLDSKSRFYQKPKILLNSKHANSILRAWTSRQQNLIEIWVMPIYLFSFPSFIKMWDYALCYWRFVLSPAVFINLGHGHYRCSTSWTELVGDDWFLNDSGVSGTHKIHDLDFMEETVDSPAEVSHSGKSGPPWNQLFFGNLQYPKLRFRDYSPHWSGGHLLKFRRYFNSNIRILIAALWSLLRVRPQ